RIKRPLAVAKLEHHRAGLAQRHGAVKARAPPRVAGAGALLLDPDPHRVLIAIDTHLDDALRVAGGFAFAPKGSTAAAEIPGLPGRDRLPQGFRVHMGDHQQIARSRVGRDADDKSIGVEFRREGAALLDLVGRAAWGEGWKFIGQEEPRAKSKIVVGRAADGPAIGRHVAHYIELLRGHDALPARGTPSAAVLGPVPSPRLSDRSRVPS